MRILFMSILLMLICQNITAQTSSLKGTVKDTLEKKVLTNAVVALLSKKDSSLYKFTRSGKDGSFQFIDVMPGKYMLLVSYPKFADYTEDIAIKPEPTDLGLVALTQRSQLLQTVLIKSAGAIRIKGDTTEFVADSFKVREGATVEELLKKLPGFQVNSKGEIVAQGQRVDKVLVDGEEFFGDDPTMATRNIGAKAVDKVQVFDTKTDQQQLTGISTGSEGKTVNIKLKEDQKKGGFGKYSVASDFQKFTDANLLYNRFIGKKKLSVYATKSNTSTGSLNWEDQRRLGMNDFEFDELSGYFMSSGGGYDETFDTWNLRGLPDAYTAGGLYSNKFNSDKQNVNLSYRYNRLGTKNEQSIATQNILPDTLFYSNQYSSTNSLNQQNAVNGKWELKIDSLSTLRFTTAFTRKVTDYDTKTRTESLSEERDTINSGYRENDGRTTKLQSDNAIQYKRMFKKQGRQLVANVRFNLVDDDGLGYLAFVNRFYRNRVLDSTSNSDQQKVNKTHSETFGGKITYGEPLSTKVSLVFEYSFNQNNARSNRNTFEKAVNGKYEEYVPQYSNNFDFEASSNTGSMFGRYNTKKVQVSIGSGVSAVQLDLHNKDNNLNRRYNFLNLTPQSSFGYMIKPNTNIRFNYRGATVQPNIEQLQPLRNNIDPLNIVEGNPNLKVGFRHALSLYYNDYRMLKQMGIWAGGSYNFTDNAIANITLINNRGVKATKPVNVSGNTNWNVWGEWNKGEGEKKLIYTAGFNGNGGTTNNFINAYANRTTYYNVEASFGLRYEVDQKWSLSFRPKLGYSSSVSSLNKEMRTEYLRYGGQTDGRLNLPGNFELRSDVDVDMRQNISAFAVNPNLIIWNAEFSKKVFKNKSGIISVLARDILNKNQGFDRIINSNFITEDRYLRVSQYFMLKIEWSFNKMGGE